MTFTTTLNLLALYGTKFDLFQFYFSLVGILFFFLLFYIWFTVQEDPRIPCSSSQFIQLSWLRFRLNISAPASPLYYVCSICVQRLQLLHSIYIVNIQDAQLNQSIASRRKWFLLHLSHLESLSCRCKEPRCQKDTRTYASSSGVDCPRTSCTGTWTFCCWSWSCCAGPSDSSGTS